MKTACVILLLLAFSSTGMAQTAQIRLSVTDNSNVSKAEIGKSLASHCSAVVITIDPNKADYELEAIYTGAGAARKPYKFSLFKPTGDYVFSTQTARLDNAVKDVCAFIGQHKR